MNGYSAYEIWMEADYLESIARGSDDEAIVEITAERARRIARMMGYGERVEPETSGPERLTEWLEGT